jgi:excinuclease UvrABC ATPase subunit
MRNFMNIINESVVEEAFDDFKDPMLDKPDNGDQPVESDFDMFKDEGDAGAPASSQDVSSEEPEACTDCDEVGKALNAKDMKVFASAYKKFSAGAIESINADEAKELAEIMIALLQSKIAEPAIEESNQDNKLARDAVTNGQPAPENPNAPKKAMTPADKRTQQTTDQTNQAAADAAADPKAAAKTVPGQKPAPGQPADAEQATGEDAKKFIKNKGIPVK